MRAGPTALAPAAPAAVRVPRTSALLPGAIFSVWAAVVVWLVLRHEMWRDEVRALSLAIDAPTLADMLSRLHGEGHPALWYLILRAGYGLTGSMLVLPVASALAAAAAIGFLLLRAPFAPLTKLLIAGSAFALVEYSVVARNYGISMLPMFVFAAAYDARRRRGVGLGLLLFVLAGTNVHSALIVLVLLGMWFVDTVGESGFAWSRSWRVFCVNAAIAGLGILLAALLVRGPANDAVSAAQAVPDAAALLRALVDPGLPFRELAPGLPSWGLSLLLAGCLLGLATRPALLVAGAGALVGLSLLFTLVYPGSYRHVAIWVVLLVSLTWIAENRGRRSRATGRLAQIGRGSLHLLLALQVANALVLVLAQAKEPWSSSKAAARLITADPRLAGAIVMAEPDFMLEPLPYYGIDRTYLLREGRFGHAVNFTGRARTALSLGEMLATARRLKSESGSEVLILVAHDLDRASPPQTFLTGYTWSFATTPAEAAAFLEATELLARLGPSLHLEDYTIYRLR